MTVDGTLHALLDHSVATWPRRVAVEDATTGETATYEELGLLSGRVRDRLRRLGVRPGDRVGIYMAKSIDAVAAIFGTLEAGATYVPVDADAPAERCAYILNDCSVRVVVGERRLESGLREQLARLGTVPPLLLLDEAAGRLRLDALLAAEEARDPAPPCATVYPAPAELAYILYTSGSTGRPKGVMLTHRSARAFVDWCSDVFQPTPDDVFSSHAPFHFDLSILDVYASLKHGARLVLIGEQLGKDPLSLAPVIAEKRISVWYSTPSILALLAQYGKLERHDFGALRLVLFAGEVFPMPRLRDLTTRWPHPRYFNLYGPTETNVCTFYEVPPVLPPERVAPLPIGHACAHYRSRVVDVDGRVVEPGAEGELLIHGPGVMEGYWNLPEQNAAAFLIDDAGRKWYHTGDLVAEDPADGYVFHGRRDRMVKRRGYRVELGEIEAGLSTHPAVREVAVVAIPDAGAGTRIKAYLGLRDGERLSIIQIKQFSVERLPRYMVPDLFGFVEQLPRTSTDKIDYQALKAQE